MSFAAPLFLLGLLAVPAGVALHLLAQRRRRRYAVRFPGAPSPPSPRRAAARWRRHLPRALLALAVAGLVLALARPERTVAVPVEQASVMLVTDTSRSMTATDVAPTGSTRRARPPTASSTRRRTSCASARSRSATAARVLQPPTTDHEQVRAALAGLPPTAARPPATGCRRARVARDTRQAPPAGRDRPAVRRQADRRPRRRRRRRRRRASSRCPSTPSRSARRTAWSTASCASRPTPRRCARSRRPPAARPSRRPTPTSSTAVYERLGSQLGTREETREVTAGFAAAGLLLLGGALAGSVRRFGRLP